MIKKIRKNGWLKRLKNYPPKQKNHISLRLSSAEADALSALADGEAVTPASYLRQLMRAKMLELGREDPVAALARDAGWRRAFD